MTYNIENYLPIKIGDAVSYSKYGIVEIYGKVEEIIDCIEEKFVVVDGWWININRVQREAA